MNITYKMILPNENLVKQLEYLRFECFDMDVDYLNANQTFYEQNILNGKVLVFGAFKKVELIGACYVSVNLKSLYIDQLFIKKDYQKEQIGKELLEYVLRKKNVIGEYYETFLTSCFLDACNQSQAFYEKIGFKQSNGHMHKQL